jgi:hypothetical protein
MSARSKPEMLRRQEALEKTLERFRDKPFKLGKDDCVQAARFHLRAMGHSPPATGHYATAIGARRALGAAIKKKGGKSYKQPRLDHLLDLLLPRIAPAAMLPGDLALLPEDEDGAVGLGGTVVISVGTKFFAWHPDAEGFSVLEPIVDRPFTAAWRA